MKKNLGNLLFLLLFSMMMIAPISALSQEKRGSTRTIQDVLDKENSYPDRAIAWQELRPFAIGTFLFLSGFTLAYFLPLKRSSKQKTKEKKEQSSKR